jgi:hypothetical protein
VSTQELCACLLVGALALAGCGAGELTPTTFDGGTCTASISQVPILGANHVPQGSALSFSSNPPAGGDHYPDWLRWTRAYEGVERGNYVHNAEHGGVVILESCTSGCEALRAALLRLGQSLPQDPICTPPINARWLVVHDPALPPGLGVAAMAWGWTFTAPCLDEAKLRSFLLDHYGQGPEALCFDGRLP